MAQAHNPSYSGGSDRGPKFETSKGKVSKTLSQKQNTNKKTRGMAQEVQACLASSRP
jgi:hypothetical protein